MFNIDSASKDELLDLEEERIENLLNLWGVSLDDSISSRIHIPCGKRIFDIEGAILKGISRRNREASHLPRIVEG